MTKIIITGMPRFLVTMFVLSGAACSNAGPQSPKPSFVNREQQDASAGCDAALTDTSETPPRRLAEPIPKRVASGNMLPLVKLLAHASPSPALSIPFACGVVRFFFASNGTVQNATALADYPPNIGLGDALATYVAQTIYPPSAAGGPYGVSLSITSKRKLVRRPAAS